MAQTSIHTPGKACMARILAAVCPNNVSSNTCNAGTAPVLEKGYKTEVGCDRADLQSKLLLLT